MRCAVAVIVVASAALSLTEAAFAADGLTPVADATVNAPATGDPGVPQAADQQGNNGDDGIQFGAVNITVINNSTVTGGGGAAGGSDTNASGGNTGGNGGSGVNLPPASNGISTSVHPTFINSLGAAVIGGGGGDGSNGGGGNAKGGSGGDGRAGITVDASFAVITNNGTITGGAGGAGGDAAGNGNGGIGGVGYYGVFINASDVQISNSGTIQGGAAGAGGTGSVNGASGAAFGGVFSGHVRTTLNNTSTILGGNGLAQSAVFFGANDAVILNSGLIAGGAGTGVEFGAGGAGGTLTNSGTISSSAGNAVSIARQVESFTNTGGIVTSAGAMFSGAALSLEADQIDDFAIVGGTISNTRGADNTGVALYIGAGQTGIVSSTASIVSNGTGAGQGIAILFGGDLIFDNAGIVTGNIADSNNVQVNFGNSGTVNGDISFVTTAASSVSNSGTINGDVSITSNADGVGLTNVNGTIVGDMIFAGTGSHTFTFQGAASAVAGNLTGGTGTDAIDLSGGTFNGNILLGDGANAVFVNGTTLTGTLIGGNGVDALTLRSGTLNGNADLGAGANVVIVDGTFDTDGTIAATGGNFNLQVASTGVFTAEDQMTSLIDVTVAAGGRLNVASINLIAAGLLTNAGTIAIDPDLLFRAGSMTAGGTYIFGLTGSGEIGQLGVLSGAIDFTGTTLQMSLQPASAPIVSGSYILIAQGSDPALGITDGQQVADNSALLNFYAYNGSGIYGPLYENQIYVQAVASLLADIAAHGDDPNAVALGAALDEIGLDGNADIDDLMQALALFGTDEEINETLDSLLPETDGVAYDIATDAGEQILDVASRRLDGLRGTAVAMREYKLASTVPVGSTGAKNANRFWGQVFGRAVNQSKHNYNEGYDAGTYGFALGADTALSGGKALLGVAFAYGQTEADGNGINRTGTDVDSYQLVVYGDHAFADAVYTKGLIAYGWHQNDIVRHDVGGIIGNNASGNYDATQFNARAEIGRAFAAGRNLTLVPRIDLTYAAYDPDSYSETGVGGLSLNVDGETLQTFRLGAGILARWDVPLDDGGLFQPELRLNYRRDLSRDRFETASEFIGAPGIATFRTQGVEPPADILNLGGGALLATAGGVDLRASYDLELKQDYTAHAGYIRAGYRF